MHIRRKAYARPELAACPWYVSDPENHRGAWRSLFPELDRPLHLDLGCGKGISTAQMAWDCPDVNYLAVDLSEDILGSARRVITGGFGARPVENVILVNGDILTCDRFFGPEDAADRIYISFPIPWNKHRNIKKRLTYPRQLMQYRTFMKDGAEIWFRTDDDRFFEESLPYFDVCGFTAEYITRDLIGSGFTPHWSSEYENKAGRNSIPIKFGIFRKQKEGVRFVAEDWRR